jgi:hypothetical protein
VEPGYAGYLINRATSNYTSVVNEVVSNPSTGDAIFVLTPTPSPSPPPEITPEPTPTQPPTVGGEFAPVSILQLLAPYLLVACLGAAAIASLVMYRKRTK